MKIGGTGIRNPKWHNAVLFLIWMFSFSLFDVIRGDSIHWQRNISISICITGARLFFTWAFTEKKSDTLAVRKSDDKGD